MGSLLRSELMSLCQIFLQPDSAFISVSQLGERGICQFRDLNNDVSAYNRKYMMEIKRCDEMQRQLKFVESAIDELGLDMPFAPKTIAAPLPRDIHELESKFEKLEEELLQIKNSTGDLRRNYLQITNLKQVLAKVQILLNEGQLDNARQSINDAQHGFGPIYANGNAGAPPNLIEGGGKDEKYEEPSELKFIVGSIRKDRVPAFERVLWRMTHGNVYTRTIDIEQEPNAPFKDEHRRAAFLVFFSGEQLRSKVRKICEGFRTDIVDNCPDSPEGRHLLLVSAEQRLNDMSTVIHKTLEHRDRVLHAASLSLRTWEVQVLKLKAVFHTLNMFNLDITQKCLIAECWIPTDDIPQMRAALEYATEISGSNVSSVVNILHAHETPPTFNRVNKFTRAFQNIVDSYGIANYREINPAPWTIISFPFIFAVMFGDVGHGLVMFLAALGLVLFEKKIEAARIKDEIFNTFYGGRYVILLMGIFAMYTGFIYNDFFSKSVNIFGSGWRMPKDVVGNITVLGGNFSKEMDYDLDPGAAFLHSSGPYPFGLDPVWNVAKNKLNFMNPMKMKSSVIIGISQMFFGLMLSLFNHLHFHSTADILFVFIPQLLFLSLIFVYLCVQIIIKWIFFWVTPGTILGYYYPSSHCAPSLLIGLISMFMLKDRPKGYMKPDGTAVDTCFLDFWYPGQDIIEKIFIFVAVLCIPVMLFVKPVLMWLRARRGEHVERHHGGGGDEDDGEFNLGDTFVYQAIHTIEFALGCISHTASYLRLWALSLAHAQLSEVLWTMVLKMALTSTGVIGIIATVVIFAIFALLSVAILVLMEGLSAFLHALRLHWVEFQSKFYGGNGVLFEPFSFAQLIRVYEGADS